MEESAIFAFSASSLMRWTRPAASQIDAAVLLEFIDDPIDHDVVPVITAEVRVAVGGLYFENAIADFEHGDVERAATQVIHGDLLVLLLVETVGQRSRGRLVDDAKNFQARDLARVLGRVALRVVEVSRNSDDGLSDLLAELRFRVGSSVSPESSRRFPAERTSSFRRSPRPARARRRWLPSRSCTARDALPRGPRRTCAP